MRTFGDGGDEHRPDTDISRRLSLVLKIVTKNMILEVTVVIRTIMLMTSAVCVVLLFLTMNIMPFMTKTCDEAQHRQ